MENLNSILKNEAEAIVEAEKIRFVTWKLQSQIFTLILVVLILVTLSIVIYLKVKKQKIDEAPKGILLVAEQYVGMISKLYDESAGQLQKPAPYIFTLITFLGVGNIFGIFGLNSITSSYSVALVLALITWIGTYVVGLTYHKFRFFKKWLNPIDFIGQFAPLISLSFRIFGNIVGGSIIVYLLYTLTGTMWGYIPFIGEVNILGALIAPAAHVYFDIFGALVQAYVFTLLTLTYWSMEAGEPEPHEASNEQSISQITTKLV